MLTGERSYGEAARHRLLHDAGYWTGRYEAVDLKMEPEFGAWSPLGEWAWAYDLAYDVFEEEERALVERWLRVAAQTIIEGEKLWTTTPNLVFGKHFNVGLVGYCLGEQTFIDWALNDPGAHGPHRGGFYPVLDTMIKDGHFWGEAPIYALHYDVHGMLALAEAALHYDGTDLYNWVSKKSGASIKSIIDGYVLMAYPPEKTGVGGGSVRLGTFGDGSTCFGPTGGLGDTFLVNSVSGGSRQPGRLAGELEIAYKRYGDPGYAWLLSLDPRRDTFVTYGRATLGLVALTHGMPLPENPTPPPASCGVYPSQGFAVLRSDESPRYWTSGGTTAMVRLGAAVGHGHEDYFSIVLHGKGRLLYPDINVIQYEPTYLNWTHEGIAHSTLLVDRRSPRPGDFTTRHDFTPDAKFFAITGSSYENVTQTRNLVLTGEYLVDVFRAADLTGRRRTFDWVLHGLGRLYPGSPASYQPSDALVPCYWWVDNERSRTTDAAWQADWIQEGGGVTRGVQRFSDEWFEQNVGVRMTMLGAKNTQIFCGDGPITDGPPHARIEGNPEGSSLMIVARRTAAAAKFAAVHEPYDQQPAVRRIAGIQDTDDAIGLAVGTAEFSDRVLIAFEADKQHTLRGPDGEAFTFNDYAYVRVAGDRVLARGKLSAFRIRAAEGSAATLNGNRIATRRDGDFLVFGNLAGGEGGPPGSSVKAVDPAEHRAYLHYYFLPEEVHLSADGEKEARLHVRCVGRGAAEGVLRFEPPPGIAVRPEAVDLRMTEGDEKVVALRLAAAPDAGRGLRTVRVRPADGTPAASAELLVSVGVVITEDDRLPRLGEYVVRAPGYTMRVDKFSGVSYYLLDGEGHRRYGRAHNTNFIFGFGAVARDGKWSFRNRMACRFIWRGSNTLTVGCDGTYGDHDVRLRYTFHEDRIAIGIIPPTRVDRQQTMWLGNFDALGKPAEGAARSHFFPHPVYRQGILVTLPPEAPLQHTGTAVNFPLRTGQEVILQFVTEDELPEAGS